jgi:hypothetical protein
MLKLFSQTKGLTFASVHDSYWTHACSIDDMSAIIRDTFIALHSSDVLKRLRDEVSSIALHELDDCNLRGTPSSRNGTKVSRSLLSL